jgi:hypothetical protein
MGHSLNGTSFKINNTLIIKDGHEMPDHILISDENGVVKWDAPNDYITDKPNNHYIGELFGGGVVVSVWMENGIERCLVAAPENLSTFVDTFGGGSFRYGFDWSNIQSTGSGATYKSFGSLNTDLIITQSATSSAKKCFDYLNPDLGTGVWDDWYLPSVYELNQFINNAAIVNKVLDSYTYDNNIAKKDTLSVNVLYQWPDWEPSYTTSNVSPSNINLLTFGPTKYVRYNFDLYDYTGFDDIDSNDADYYWSSSEDSATHAWAVMAGKNSLSVIVAPVVSDTDAQAFINAAAIMDTTQANAINTLVVDLKAAGVWTKMKAIYPMVGGTASSHKFNLKDPRDLDIAYRLYFFGGFNHDGRGAIPNGNNTYAETFLTPSTSLANNSQHLSYYSLTDQATSNTCELGSVSSSSGIPGSSLAIKSTAYNNGTTVGLFLTRVSGGGYDSYGITPPTDTRGFAMTSRSDLSSVKAYWNGSYFGQTSQTFVSNPISLKLFARSYNTIGTEAYSSKICAFASIGDGLTDLEATSFYNAVQKFQTTLGRQIGTAINPPTQVLPSFNLDSVVLPKSTLCKVRPFRVADDTQKTFQFDADYAIITYKFSGELDLDTRTKIISPNLPQSESGYGTNFDGVGWTPDYPTHPNSSTYSVIWHANDNMGSGYETVLINFKAFKYYYPGQSEIIIDAKAHWFVQSWVPDFTRDPYDQLRLDETPPVVLSVDLYKGGFPIKNPSNLNQWINPSAGASMSLDSYGKVINTEFYAGAGTGQRVAKLKYNVVGKFGYLFIND